MPTPTSSPVLIETDHKLHQLVTSLKSQPHVAVDTESNSLYAYKEQVCLIQFSIPDNDYLVDPLKIKDLGALGPLFESADHEKILHGAEYDLICLKRDFGFKFSNMFDTRVASRTLGWKRSGLGDLVEEVFGTKISKRHQRANWGKRPLSSDLLDYARLDTHYLIPLRNHLSKSLRSAGQWEQAYELSQRLTGVEVRDDGFDPDGFWRIASSNRLSGRQLAILKELYLFRDVQARRLNRPPFKVLGNKTLLAITTKIPKNMKALISLPGMTAGQAKRYGDGLLASVERGLQAPRPKKRRSQQFDERTQARFEKLHTWRKDVARKRKVESDIILPRELLIEIARHAPKDKQALRQLMLPLEWRFQTFGEEILIILSD